MKETLLKTLGLIGIMIMVGSLVMMVLGQISFITFLIIAGIIYLGSKYGFPYLRGEG